VPRLSARRARHPARSGHESGWGLRTFFFPLDQTACNDDEAGGLFGIGGETPAMAAAIDEIQIEPLIFPERRLVTEIGWIASRDRQARKRLPDPGRRLRVGVSASKQCIDDSQLLSAQAHALSTVTPESASALIRRLSFCEIPDKARAAFRDLMTRMFSLAEEALKTLANFRSTVMAGLDPAIQS